MTLSIIALAIAIAAAYYAVVTVVNNRASVHFARAAGLYAERRHGAGNAEMERGRKLARRGDRMLVPWRSAKGGGS